MSKKKTESPKNSLQEFECLHHLSTQLNLLAKEIAYTSNRYDRYSKYWHDIEEYVFCGRLLGEPLKNCDYGFITYLFNRIKGIISNCETQLNQAINEYGWPDGHEVKVTILSIKTILDNAEPWRKSLESHFKDFVSGLNIERHGEDEARTILQKAMNDTPEKYRQSFFYWISLFTHQFAEAKEYCKELSNLASKIGIQTERMKGKCSTDAIFQESSCGANITLSDSIRNFIDTYQKVENCLDEILEKNRHKSKIASDDTTREHFNQLYHTLSSASEHLLSAIERESWSIHRAYPNNGKQVIFDMQRRIKTIHIDFENIADHLNGNPILDKHFNLRKSLHNKQGRMARAVKLNKSIDALDQYQPKPTPQPEDTEQVQKKENTHSTGQPIEIDLDGFNESINAKYDFKQDIETLASQRYIKYRKKDEATKAARRVRERLKTKYSSVKIKQDGDTLRLVDGISLIIKK